MVEPKAVDVSVVQKNAIKEEEEEEKIRLDTIPIYLKRIEKFLNLGKAIPKLGLGEKGYLKETDFAAFYVTVPVPDYEPIIYLVGQNTQNFDLKSLTELRYAQAAILNSI